MVKNHKCVLHLNFSDFHSLALMFQEMGFFFSPGDLSFSFSLGGNRLLFAITNIK